MNSTFPILLATFVDGNWRPGIGDPSAIGWATVVAYFAAAIACWMAARAERRLGPAGLVTEPRFWRVGSDHPVPLTGSLSAGRRVLFWQMLAVGMVLLGINKQLDLQSVIPIIGRQVAMAQGWYEDRQMVQRAFITGVAIAGIGTLVIIAFLFRSVAMRRPMAPLGMVYLLVFILVRASSFHKVDVFLADDVLGMRVNRLLELGGIACVFVSALLCIREGRRAAGSRP